MSSTPFSSFAEAGRVAKSTARRPALFSEEPIDAAIVAELKETVDVAFIASIRRSRYFAGSVNGVVKGCAMTGADPATEALIRGIEIGRMYERIQRRIERRRPLVDALTNGVQ